MSMVSVALFLLVVAFGDVLSACVGRWVWPMGGPSIDILLFFPAIPHGFIVLVMVVETIVQGCGSGLGWWRWRRLLVGGQFIDGSGGGGREGHCC